MTVDPDRLDVFFDSWGDRCAAWLYRPADPEGVVPCVVMGGGFTAVREMRLDAFAERLARAGFAALVFDYRHFGASDGEPRQLLDVKRQLADWASAIAYARTLDGVDPERIAVWGSSLGGGHVMTTAARDHRLAAAVAQVPFADGLAQVREFPPAQALRLTAEGLKDEWAALTGKQAHYIEAWGPPGATAMMTSASVTEGMPRITPAGSSYANRVAARIATRLPWYRPGRLTPRIRCPILFCIGERDDLTPPGPAEKAAAAAPRAKIMRYPFGHYDIYVGEGFERAVADQTAFLQRHLRLAQLPAAGATA